MKQKTRGESSKEVDKPNLHKLVTYRLMLLADTLRLAASHAYSQNFGVSVPELRILATVSGEQPISANELSRRTRIDKGWISRSIDDLTERGLLLRKASKTDRRQKDLWLSKKGSKLVDQLWPYALERSRRVIDGMAADEIHQIIDILQERADEILSESMAASTQSKSYSDK